MSPEIVAEFEHSECELGLVKRDEISREVANLVAFEDVEAHRILVRSDSTRRSSIIPLFADLTYLQNADAPLMILQQHPALH